MELRIETLFNVERLGRGDFVELLPRRKDHLLYGNFMLEAKEQ